MRLLMLMALGPPHAVVAAALDDLRAAAPLPEGFTPRFSFERDASHRPAAAVHAKRDGNCGADKHPCLDINHPERCCANDSYCYISKDSQPKCCPIGSNCVDDSFCPSQAFFCTSTLAAPTGMRTVSGSGSGPSPSPTPAPQSVVLGCCARACPQTSFYLCPTSLGGNCCPFGSDCRAGGGCVGTQTASVTPPRPLSPETPCATGQLGCSDGNGCCAAGLQCTTFRGTGYCASPSALVTPIATLSPSGPDHSGSGNGSGSGSGTTSGKTIGLAVGLSLGVSLILAILAWFLLQLKRRRAKLKDADAAAAAVPPPVSPSFRPDASSTSIPWYPDEEHDAGADHRAAAGSEQVKTTPAVRVLHEPNGPGAAPVEMDSTGLVEVAGTEVSALSPVSRASGLGDDTRLSVTSASWLQLSPTSPP